MQKCLYKSKGRGMTQLGKIKEKTRKSRLKLYWTSHKTCSENTTQLASAASW